MSTTERAPVHLDQLGDHVETIVGPLRASQTRKQWMREEMLEHLVHASDESGGDDADEAIKRFGDPEALRIDLQSSVPPVEAAMFTQLPWLNRLELWARPRAGESPGRHSFRLARAASMLALLIVMVGNPLFQIAFKRNTDWERMMFVGLSIWFCLSFFLFAFSFAAMRLHANATILGPDRKIDFAVACNALGCAASLIAFGMLFAFFARQFYFFDRLDFVLLILASALVAFATWACSVATLESEARCKSDVGMAMGERE